MRLDRKFTIFREVETGRDALNAVLTEAQLIASGWCAAGPLERARYETLGLTANLEVMALILRHSSAVSSVGVGDRVDLDGTSYLFKSVGERAGSRRGFVELIATREVG